MLKKSLISIKHMLNVLVFLLGGVLMFSCNAAESEAGNNSGSNVTNSAANDAANDAANRAEADIQFDSELSDGISSGMNTGGINTDSYLQVFIGLLAVIFVIFFLSVLLKKLNMLPKGSGLIKILAGISIGNKDRLLLIQVGEEQILIGTSPGRVSKIHQLSEKVLLQEESNTSSPENNFKNLLKSVTGKDSL